MLRCDQLRISIIAAVSENGIIGQANGLPWILPNDLSYFKKTTMGKPIIMGRRTYEGLGKPLPGRPNLIVSRNPCFKFEDLKVFESLPEAIFAAFTIGGPEVFLIGGAAVYTAGLNVAERLYITEVHARVEGDVYFPVWDKERWREISRERQYKCERNEYDHSFVVFERVTKT